MLLHEGMLNVYGCVVNSKSIVLFCKKCLLCQQSLQVDIIDFLVRHVNAMSPVRPRH